MKTLDTSTFDFPSIIKNDFLYVDKTDVIFELIKKPKGQYFLSRPRRFGKSLTISTIKAIFQGQRELFKGLAIDSMPYDWTEYPVIHLDFSNCGADTPQTLIEYLDDQMKDIAAEHEVSIRGNNYDTQFENLIKDVADKGKVVILVDEYDKPILGNIMNPKVADILKVMKAFYSNLKKTEKSQRFCLITGVSKICHVSVFSDLNNLTDITLATPYASLVGFTEAEIRKYYADRLEIIAAEKNSTVDELMANIKRWYDGYRFSDADVHVCNPVSTTKFFEGNGKFTNFWVSTGTPSFLLQLIRNSNLDIEAELKKTFSDELFNAYEIDHLEPMGLLWQTGYVTISDVLPDESGSNLYKLDFPDLEVRRSFIISLVQTFADSSASEVAALSIQLRQSIAQNDLELFMQSLQAFFSSITYQDVPKKDEKTYQLIFKVLFMLLGVYVETEVSTSDGRIDAVIKNDSHIYIFEFKLRRTAKTALGQIADKRYFLKYQACGKNITLIGIRFDVKKRYPTDWAICESK